MGEFGFFSETRSIVKYENEQFTTLSKGKDYQGTPKTFFGGKDQPLIISTEKGHFRYEDGKFVKFEIATSNADSIIIHIDRDGGMWLADKGMHTRRVKNGKVEYFDFPNSIDKKMDVNAIADDQYGNYWLSFRAFGTFRIRKGKVELVDKEFFTLKLSTDSAGNLWVFKTDKTYKINAGNLDDEKIDLNKVEVFSKETDKIDSNIQAILKDPKSGLWAGTHNGGLLHITSQKVRVFSGKDWGNENEIVYPILEDRKGEVWLGLWAADNSSLETIVKYDNNKNIKIVKNNTLGRFISAFYEDSNGRIWIGLIGGFGYFENQEFVPILRIQGKTKPFTVHAISQNRSETVWIATDKGLFEYSKKGSNKFEKIEGLRSDFVTSFLNTKDGKFWIGTKNGLSILENGEFKNITEQDDLKNDYVRSLYEDDEGVIWIGTYDAGLLRYKDGEFKRIAKKDGLFNGNVFCTLEDDNGWFWINSNRGIYRVRKQELNDFADGKTEKVLSIGYTKNDGLLSSEGNGGKQPAGIKRKNGELWFPTQKGVAVINPNEIETDSTPPPVYIEEIFVDKHEVDKNEGSIEIQPEQSNLEINYTGLSFTNPDLVKFRYRLEGFEENWNDVGTRRMAFYNNLAPGEYKFQVIAANRDGVWNKIGATIKIVKLPYYYQTWWFQILSALLITGVLYLLYQYRISNLKKISEAKSRFSRQLIESQESERKRIAADLHDGLGQELVIIKNRAEQGKDSVQELADISESSSQALEEVREIINDLRPQLVDQLGVTKAIKAMLRKVSGVIGIESEIDEIDSVFSEDDEITVYRIVQELMNNAVKHSKASDVIVKIKRSAESVRITVEDNGSGFDPDSVSSDSFGLIGLKERTNLIGGDLTISSQLGEGTKVKIIINILK